MKTLKRLMRRTLYARKIITINIRVRDWMVDL